MILYISCLLKRSFFKSDLIFLKASYQINLIALMDANFRVDFIRRSKIKYDISFLQQLYDEITSRGKRDHALRAELVSFGVDYDFKASASSFLPVFKILSPASLLEANKVRKGYGSGGLNEAI